MSRKAGVISIDIQAGTAKFTQDMEIAKGKLREFGQAGHTSVTGVQAVSASLRVLEGNMTNNLRASERFAANVLGLGPLLQKAFPVVGAIAFAGILAELGTKVTNFFKTLKEGPEKTAGAFRELSSSLGLANAGLEVTNTRLQNDIAKLEGKRQNTLKLALDEAREAAEKLSESLNKNLSEVDKIMGEPIGILDRLMGTVSDDKIRQRIAEFQTNIKATAKEGSGRADAAKTPADADAIRVATNASIQKQSDDLKAYLDSAYRDYQRQQEAAGSFTITNFSKVMEEIKGLYGATARMATSVQLQTTGTGLTEKKGALTANDEDARARAAYPAALQRMMANLESVQAKVRAIGQPADVQATANALHEAQMEIVKIDKALKEAHQSPLTDSLKASVLAIAKGTATAEIEEEWKKKIFETKSAIDARISSQELLTAAIGRGYEATKAANVETKLMEYYAANPLTPASERGALGSRFGAEFDTQHADQTGQATQKLRESIQLENALADAYKNGAAAVRQLELNYKLLEIARTNPGGAIGAEGVALIEQEAASQNKAAKEREASTEMEIGAQIRLNAAIMQGAAARRQAALANEIVKINAGPGTGDQKAVAIAQAKDAAQLKEISRIQEIAEHSDRLRGIDEEINDLYAARNVDGSNTAAIDADILAKEKERLRVMADIAQASSSAADGARAVFLEMQANAKTTGQIVYDSIKQAVEGSENVVAKNLSDLASGQYKKGEFGKDMQRQAGSQLQSFLKMGMEKLTGGHKPTGTASDPFHVVTGADKGTGAASGAMGKLAGTVGKVPGVGGWLQKLLGGTSPGGAPGASGIQLPPMQKAYDTSGAAFGAMGDMPALAGGGDVDPGNAYWVGENGPEPFVPRTSGTVISRDSLGGGDTHNHYNIDARGAALGVENRIASSIQAAHDAAVTNAVKTSNERSKRTPQRKG